MFLNHSKNLFHSFDNILHRDALAIDLEPLPKRRNMGRGEHANFEAQVLETVGYFAGDTPFTIGASDMNGFEFTLVRVVEEAAELEHRLQV